MAQIDATVSVEIDDVGDDHRAFAAIGFQPRLSGLVEQLVTAYHVFMPTLVKRYARTRRYDTEALRYVTVAELMLWVSKGIRFVVIDAETGEDITRILLA
jgi:hypothetical protein